MDAVEFEKIQSRIKVLELEIAKAEGNMERIVGEWKTQYKIGTIEEAEALLKEKVTEVELLKTRQDAEFTKLKALADWDKV